MTYPQYKTPPLRGGVLYMTLSNLFTLPTNKFQIRVRFIAFHCIHIIGRVDDSVLRLSLYLELALWLFCTQVQNPHSSNLNASYSDPRYNQGGLVKNHSSCK